MAMSAANETNPTVIFNPATSKYSVIFNGFSIETTVTDKASVAEEWVRLVCAENAGNHTVVGLDTEWMPHSVTSKMKAAILQLCVENRCLILQLFHMDDLPRSLRSFLVDSNFTFVGVQVGLDIAKLKREYGLECENGVDVLLLAKKLWPERFSSSGLKHLAQELVGLEMKKPADVCTSEWQTRELNEAQVEYACIDAYASYRIGHKLLIENQGIVPSD